MQKTSRALKIYLMGLSLVLSSCKSLPEFPVPTLKQPLFEKEVTREFEFKDENWVFMAQHDLSYTNGMFCVTAEEYQKIRNWLVDVKENYSCKLKKKDANGNVVNEDIEK